jgi:two-component system chemotaxis response regulator CheB
MTRVLIVDDSEVARQLLCHILSADPDIEVVGVASNGRDAVFLNENLKPDVMTIDINMPIMDGFETTRAIMETHPVPIVIVSSAFDNQEASAGFQSMQAGALAILPRPQGLGHPRYKACALELIQTLKTMAGVTMVRRHRPKPKPSPSAPTAPAAPSASGTGIQLVVIGASTGGPQALETFLQALPRPFPVPIALVQHIAPGFAEGFVEWLAKATHLPIALARNGELLAPGMIRVAPDGSHLEIGHGLVSLLTSYPPDNSLRPSVKRLFKSAARISGNRTAAVLLSGMGRDGAEEMKELKDAGALTLAQSEASCIVFGMPGEAVRLGAARHVLPPELLARQLAASLNAPPFANS